MEERKLVVKTDMRSVVMDYAMTFSASFLIAIFMLVVFGDRISPFVPLIMLAVLLLALYSAIVNSRGEIIFMAADQYKGPRMMVRLKKNDYEVYDTKAEHYIIKQNRFEKKRNTGRIRVKNTNLYLRGVSNIDQVEAFLQKHFR